MRTILNLNLPLWVVAVLAVILAGGGWLNGCQQRKQLDRQKAKTDSVSAVLDKTRTTLDSCQRRDDEIYLAYVRAEMDKQRIIDAKGLQAAKQPLRGQVKIVYRTLNLPARPDPVAIPAYLNRPPVITHTARIDTVCYDSTTHAAITAAMTELETRRVFDSLQTQQLVRTEKQFQEFRQQIKKIELPGILKRRRRLLREALSQY